MRYKYIYSCSTSHEKKIAVCQWSNWNTLSWVICNTGTFSCHESESDTWYLHQGYYYARITNIVCTCHRKVIEIASLTRHWKRLTGLSSQLIVAIEAASWSGLSPRAAANTGRKSSRCSSLNSPNHCTMYRICASEVKPGADILRASGRCSTAAEQTSNDTLLYKYYFIINKQGKVR